MLFGNDRQALRRQFREAWNKRLAGIPLAPLEAQIARVIERHPEYQAAVVDEDGEHRDFDVEGGGVNPFLHLAMHLALEEQRATDRPAGIAAALAGAERARGDRHAAEHAAMECLGEALWQAQRNGRPPDEHAYLSCLRRLSGRGR